MKVDKFDYNRQKEVIINTIDELNDEHQISNTELNKIKNLTDEKSSEYLIRYNSHKYNI